MKHFIMEFTIYASMALGASVILYLAIKLFWITLNYILGLLKFGKIFIEWTRYKGKYKKCRSSDVYTPKLKH